MGGLKPTFSLSSMLPDDTSNGNCTEPKSPTSNAFSGMGSTQWGWQPLPDPPNTRMPLKVPYHPAPASTEVLQPALS